MASQFFVKFLRKEDMVCNDAQWLKLQKNKVTPVLIAHASGKCGGGTAAGLERVLDIQF